VPFAQLLLGARPIAAPPPLPRCDEDECRGTPGLLVSRPRTIGVVLVRLVVWVGNAPLPDGRAGGNPSVSLRAFHEAVRTRLVDRLADRDVK